MVTLRLNLRRGSTGTGASTSRCRSSRSAWSTWSGRRRAACCRASCSPESARSSMPGRSATPFLEDTFTRARGRRRPPRGRRPTPQLPIRNRCRLITLRARLRRPVARCRARAGGCHCARPRSAAQGFAAMVSPPRFELTGKPGQTQRQVIEIMNADAQARDLPHAHRGLDARRQGGGATIRRARRRQLSALGCHRAAGDHRRRRARAIVIASR